MGYIGQHGYYEGDRQGNDQEVPDRPDSFHDWNGNEWVMNASRFNDSIYAKIKALETSENLARPTRDLIKKSHSADAAQAGVTLDQLYAMALLPGAPEAALAWKKFKDFDDAIQALKAQRL